MANLSRHYGVQELNYWSPVLGADAVRISMVNEHGSEYFCVIERVDGPAWRAAKKDACEALEEAIAMGLAPGEIRWR